MHKTITVYRLETEGGNGYYQVGCPGPGATPTSPLPENDSGLEESWRAIPYSRRKDWFFGFGSMESLRAWFSQDDYLALAEERRVGLAVYEVPVEHVHQGYAQVVFQRPMAKRVHWYEATLAAANVALQGERERNRLKEAA